MYNQLNRTKAYFNKRAEDPFNYPTGDDIVNYACVCAYDFVLDVGSGAGDVTVAAISKGAITVSLDFSKEWLTLLKRNVPEVTCVVGDAACLPFRDDLFDKVIAKAIWVNIPTSKLRMEFVLETARVLKPGSTAVISHVWSRFGQFFNLKRWMWQQSPFPKDDWLHHYFTPFEVRSMFGRAKLKIVKIRAPKLKGINGIPIVSYILSPWYSALVVDIKAFKLWHHEKTL